MRVSYFAHTCALELLFVMHEMHEVYEMKFLLLLFSITSQCRITLCKIGTTKLRYN